MTHDDPLDLETMSASWQADAGPDPAEVRTDVRRTIVQSRLAFIAEMAVSAAGLVAGLALIFSGRPLIGASVVVFSGFAGLASYLSRGPAWRVSLRSVMQEIDILDRQTRLIQRAGWAGVSVSLAAALFLFVLLATSGFDWAATRDQLVLGFSGGFILVSFAWSLATLRRAKRRADQLRAAKASMTDPD